MFIRERIRSSAFPYDDIDSLIWRQAGTLGKEGALVKSVAGMGVSANGGWGEVLAGEDKKRRPLAQAPFAMEHCS